MHEVQSMPTEWQEGQYNRDASVFPRSIWVIVRAWTSENNLQNYSLIPPCGFRGSSSGNVPVHQAPVALSHLDGPGSL